MGERERDRASEGTQTGGVETEEDGVGERWQRLRLNWKEEEIAYCCIGKGTTAQRGGTKAVLRNGCWGSALFLRQIRKARDSVDASALFTHSPVDLENE